MGVMRNSYKVLVRKPEADSLEDPAINGKVI
jgi:hypothetical protein